MSVQTPAMCDQCSCFVRLLGAGQNLPTLAGESVVAQSPSLAIPTPPPPDSQDHLAYLHAAGHQQLRPQVKLPRPKATVRLPVIPAPKTRARALERETGIIQPASSIWKDKIYKLLDTRRLIPHAPRYKHDSDELSVATKVPWSDASQLLLPPVATTVLIPTSGRTDGPRDPQDSKDGTAITNEVAADRRVSTGVSAPIADLIPASPLKAESLQRMYERGQTEIPNRVRDEMPPFGFGRHTPGSKKALVSIPTGVSESLRVLLMSDKMLNTRLAPAFEAPKAVRPETVMISEDEGSAEGPSDAIFINLVGLGSKKAMPLRPHFGMTLSTAGHENCHEIAVDVEEKYTEDGPARWAKENGEPVDKSGGTEGHLTKIQDVNNNKKSNEERCAIQLEIWEDTKGSVDNSILMQSKDKDKANRSGNKVEGVMPKYENANSQFKDEGVERVITIEDNKDMEVRFHNEDISEIFVRLVEMKDVNSDYFDIQDGLLSNRMRSDLIL